MKNFTLLLKTATFVVLTILLNGSVFGQAPEKMSYQAVIRNTNNSLVTTQAIGMQVSILQGSVTGTAIYTEDHTTTSNANGLVSIMIGTGNASLGDFSTIDWANGPYFIKTETDITGGSNYTITGTQELMSVPYALHAKTVEIDNVIDADADSTNELQNLTLQNDSILISGGNGIALTSLGNGGKTYVILSGAISDADAATKIANELGTNTQFVLIQNTTNLTTVDLSNITELVDLKIVNNTSLATVNLSNLTTIYTLCYVSNNSLLNSINLSNLNSIGETNFDNNDAMITLSLPSLNYAESISSNANSNLATLDISSLTKTIFLSINNNPSLTSINIPNLTSHVRSGFEVTNNASLSSVNVPSLPSADYVTISNNVLLASININSMTNSAGFVFGIKDNPSLTSVDLSNLTLGATTGFEFKNNTSITSLDLSGLTNFKYIDIIGNTLLNSLNLSNLTTGLTLRVQQNNSLTTLATPNLSSLTTYDVSENSSLTNIDISGLLGLPQQNFLAFGNAFSSSTVNSLLAYFVSFTPTSGSISLHNQNPPAPPTGQGITDRNTLTSNGLSVYTD